tara:strand:+ start:116 stop:442 length:327 start_codon:yes stop_codon:yes gene_type:complete
MNFDHIALTVPKGKIEETVNWYKENLSASVVYSDKSWGLIRCNGVKIAFVIPKQHPPHIAFNLNDNEYIQYKSQGKIFKKHRDGSESFYDKDCQGNILEFLFWPMKSG